ncbi:hypothetical protein BSKO_06264 [Bryopsis sp. KO-2023]|nr:hypothetical protein BSKO_06264 [Bryopsis sp. KO-2023]
MQYGPPQDGRYPVNNQRPALYGDATSTNQLAGFAPRPPAAFTYAAQITHVPQQQAHPGATHPHLQSGYSYSHAYALPSNIPAPLPPMPPLPPNDPPPPPPANPLTTFHSYGGDSTPSCPGYVPGVTAAVHQATNQWITSMPPPAGVVRQENTTGNLLWGGGCGQGWSGMIVEGGGGTNLQGLNHGQFHSHGVEPNHVTTLHQWDGGGIPRTNTTTANPTQHWTGGGVVAQAAINPVQHWNADVSGAVGQTAPGQHWNGNVVNYDAGGGPVSAQQPWGAAGGCRDGANPGAGGVAGMNPVGNWNGDGLPRDISLPAAGSPPWINSRMDAGIQSGVRRKAIAPVVVPVVEVSALFDKVVQHGRGKKVVVILRGMPGSGKSEAARRLREMAISKGLDAPRIHSIDDYFMLEVENTVAESESCRKGKQRKVVELQYCYEPEMEGNYQLSLVKAFTRTIDEGRFNFVILDAPHPRFADFRDCMLVAQRAGYEVYVLQPLETDPQVCHGRNIHSRTLEDISRMQAMWEEPPAVLPQLDVRGLFSDKEANSKVGIREVEMEAEESDEEDHRTQSREATRKTPRTKRSISSKPTFSSRWDTLDSLEQNQQQGQQGLAPAEIQKEDGESAKAREDEGGSDLREVIQRAQTRRVRWADEEEELDGFHIQGMHRKLEEVFYVSGLGPGGPIEMKEARAPTTFADLVKAERIAFRAKHLKCALKQGTKPE